MHFVPEHPLKRVIIDTDPGIDDAAAILMALGSPEIQIDAITTIFGNTPVENCTTNTLRILEAANRTDIPVYQGASRQFNFTVPASASHIHGSDGFGDTGLPLPEIKPQSGNAILEIIDRATSAPGEITFVAIGRLTNLALAISVEPQVADALKEVVVMGGTVHVPGNATPVATANLWGDPEAVNVVYSSGANIVQIGLDVCNEVEIPLKQQEIVWAKNTPATRLLQAITPFKKSPNSKREGLPSDGGIHYNDVSAMAYAIDPSLFECTDLNISIETQSELTRGQAVADFSWSGSKPNTSVALKVDSDRLVQIWVKRVMRA